MKYRSVVLGRTEFLVLHYLIVGAHDHGRDPLKDIYQYGLESEEAYEALRRMAERLRPFDFDESAWVGDEDLESRYLEWLTDLEGRQNFDIRDEYIRQLTAKRDQAREELKQAQVDRDTALKTMQMALDHTQESNKQLTELQLQLEKL